MNEQENLEAVRRIYAAFGNGDIPGVIGELTEDVKWWVAGSADIPYAGTYCGHKEVLEFFERLTNAITIEHFEPQEFIVQCEQVVVIGFEAGRAKTTGCHFGNGWVQVFSFSNGKVSQFREFGDTAALEAAFTGECKD